MDNDHHPPNRISHIRLLLCIVLAGGHEKPEEEVCNPGGGVELGRETEVMLGGCTSQHSLCVRVRRDLDTVARCNCTDLSDFLPS